MEWEDHPPNPHEIAEKRPVDDVPLVCLADKTRMQQLGQVILCYRGRAEAQGPLYVVEANSLAFLEKEAVHLQRGAFQNVAFIAVGAFSDFCQSSSGSVVQLM